MDPGPRAAFNRAWSPAVHRRYLDRLSAELGPLPFRVAETPFFISPGLRDGLNRSALEIVGQLSRPELLAELTRAIPERYRAPGMDPLPSCVQVDFAITPAPGGGLEGKVVELQAFPSGYAMMLFFADAWSRELGVAARSRGRLELLHAPGGTRRSSCSATPSSAAKPPTRWCWSTSSPSTRRPSPTSSPPGSSSASRRCARPSW